MNRILALWAYLDSKAMRLWHKGDLIAACCIVVGLALMAPELIDILSHYAQCAP